MNCEICRELFIDYLGSELDHELSEKFSKHLNECSQCREKLALLSKTQVDLKVAWPDEEVPKHLYFDFPRVQSLPSSIWSAIWDMPRFAWNGLTVVVCFIVCIGSLAFLDARIQLEKSGLSLSFGSNVPAPVFQQAQVPFQNFVDREEEFKKIVDQRFRVLQKSYEGKLTKGIAQVSAQWEQQRLIDIRRIQGDLSYLQMLQKLTHQESARNKILISSMADRYLMTQVSK